MSPDLVPVRRALISVSDKTGLVDLARVFEAETEMEQGGAVAGAPLGVEPAIGRKRLRVLPLAQQLLGRLRGGFGFLGRRGLRWPHVRAWRAPGSPG